MDSLPGGDLLLVEQEQMRRLGAGHRWHAIPKPAPGDALHLRGPWLVTEAERSYDAAVGYPRAIRRTDFRFTCLDALRRVPVREYRWSVLEPR